MNQKNRITNPTHRRVPKLTPQPRMVENPWIHITDILNWVLMVVVLVFLVMVGLGFVTVTAWGAESPLPTPATKQMSAEDKVEVLKLMVKFSAGQVELSGMVRQMEQKARAVKEQGRELERLVEKLRDKYQAEGCLLDEDVEWRCSKKEVGK